MTQESSDIGIQCPKCGAPLTMLEAGDTVSLRGPAELIDGVLQARIPRALAEVLGPVGARLRPDGDFLSLPLPSDSGYAAGDIVEVSNRAGTVNFWRPVERALEPRSGIATDARSRRAIDRWAVRRCAAQLDCQPFASKRWMASSNCGALLCAASQTIS